MGEIPYYLGENPYSLLYGLSENKNAGDISSIADISPAWV